MNLHYAELLTSAHIHIQRLFAFIFYLKLFDGFIFFIFSFVLLKCVCVFACVYVCKSVVCARSILSFSQTLNAEYFINKPSKFSFHSKYHTVWFSIHIFLFVLKSYGFYGMALGCDEHRMSEIPLRDEVDVIYSHWHTEYLSCSQSPTIPGHGGVFPLHYWQDII